MKRTMKRLLCLVFALCCVVSCFVVPAGAATSSTVLEELERFTIAGEAFDETAYPADPSNTNVQLITIRETGVLLDGKRNASVMVYLYLYNPSADNTWAQRPVYVNIGFEGDDTNLHSLSSHVVYSQDYRFVRLGITIASDEVDYIGFDGVYTQNRNYFIRSLDVYNIKGVIDRTIEVRMAYHVSGTEQAKDLQYIEGDSLMMELALNATSWRCEDPISADDLGTFNAVHTVYFTVPQNVYDQYDFIDSIEAVFNRYRSKPIVVTTSDTLYNSATGSAIMSGVDVSSYNEYLYKLFYGAHVSGDPATGTGVYFYDWCYNEYLQGVRDLSVANGGVVCNQLYHMLKVSDVQIDEHNNFFQIVSSSAFRDYIYGKSEDWLEYYGEEPVNGLASICYDEYSVNRVNYNRTDEYSFKHFDVNEDATWWEKLLGKNLGTEYFETFEKFQTIENPVALAEQYATVGSDEELARTFSNAYKIGLKDVPGFVNYCKNAEGPVVLLRFAVSQYECHSLSVVDATGVVGEVDLPDITDGDAWLLQADYFLDVDVSKVRFSRDGKIVEYTVIADPVDVFPDLGVKNDYNLSAGWPWDDENEEDFQKLLEKILQILKFIAIFAVAFFVVWLVVKFVVPILAPIFKGIGMALSAPVKAAKKLQKRRKDK